MNILLRPLQHLCVPRSRTFSKCPITIIKMPSPRASVPVFSFSMRQKILQPPAEVQKIHALAVRKAPPSYQKPSDDQHFVVSLVGLPNSGKSTLFNTILGQYVAITDSIPGMTRDRKEMVTFGGLIKLIDTAGVEPEVILHKRNNQQMNDHAEDYTSKQKARMLEQIYKQTAAACKESDMIVFVVDSKSTIGEEEKRFAIELKKLEKDKKIVLAMNKAESLEETDVLVEAAQLGIKDVRVVSGEHGLGVLELMQYIDSQIPEENRQNLKEKMRLRKERFEQVKKKLRSEIENLEIPVVEWEKQFARLNPNPHLNPDLDEEEINYQSFAKPQEEFSTGRGVHVSNSKLKRPIQLAIVGRPNVGKSSLINWLLREEKMMVSQKPHTTTDSIATQFVYNQRKIKLVDTAGLASTNFDRDPEHLKKVQQNTMAVVNQSHVVVYLADAETPLKHEDLKFMQRILEEGRPLIIAVNKWEIIKPQYRRKAMNYINEQLQRKLGQINGQSVLTISVKTHEGIDKMMEEVLSVYERWNMRISTGMLNDWLHKFKKLQQLPKDGETELRIRFFVQARVRPPSFIAFVNDPAYVKTNYTRFLRHNLSEEFGLKGVPLRIHFVKARSNKPEEEEELRRDKKRRSRVTKHDKVKEAVREKVKQFKAKYGNFGVKQ